MNRKSFIRLDEGSGWPRIGTDVFKRACDRFLNRDRNQPQAVERNGARVVTIKRKVRVQSS